MRPPKAKKPGKPEPILDPPAQHPVKGAELLLSMVEARCAAANGNGDHMDSRGVQELDQIEAHIANLEAVAEEQDEDTGKQIEQLRTRIEALRHEMAVQNTAWTKTELARHPQRPYTLDYIERIFTDWSEIHGDRGFGDDPAIICGMARFHGEDVMIVGHQKARDTKQKVYRNFGMPNPEGYRKALRAMKIAEKFGRPIFTFVDTPGPIPAWARKNAGRRKPLLAIYAKWPACRCPSSR